MSENVKIKIDEYDKTSAAGSGIDSTDIVYVPGFSILEDAPQNVPVLVTSTREFEKLFGKQPVVLTHKDVEPYSDYGFISGEFDKSYVYAKELLYLGMPVLYANLCPDNLYQVLSSDKYTVSVNTMNVTASTSDEKISFTSTSESTKEVKFTVTMNVTVPAATGGDAGIATLDYKFNTQGLTSINKITPNSTGITKVSVLQYSDNKFDFVNHDTIAKNIELAVTVEISTDFIKESEAVVELLTSNTSLLDAVYKSTTDRLPINAQWEIPDPSSENPSETTIADKSIYSVKYITSGGFPSIVRNVGSQYTFSNKFADKMLSAASHRGDAVALIDYQFDPTLRVFGTDSSSDSFYNKMSTCLSGLTNLEYGAAMYPWGTYNCGSTLSFAESTMINMPPSFAYLTCLARAIKTSPNWLAMAGVTRGLVSGLSSLLVPNNVLSNSIAEEMQPKFGVENQKYSINTVTNIRPYGLTLWGNRTLKPVSKDGTVALNFLNTRNMLSDIKKLLYTTAKACMFEQNSDDLWLRFKDGIRPLLDRLKAGNGISDYKIIKGTTKYNGDPLTKGEISAVIKVYPMYAVEYFELAVEINDEEVTVE